MAPLQDYPLVGTVGIVDATEVCSYHEKT
jgi:hypothetical protein